MTISFAARASPSPLQAGGGGLRLAYKLMMTKVHHYAKILYVLQLSCWTWYSDQVANVQTPEHCMQDALASTQGKWMEDSHFQGILNDCFYRRDLPIMCSVVLAPPLSIDRLATKSHLFRKGSRFLDGILLFSQTGASAMETGLIALTMAASQHT